MSLEDGQFRGFLKKHLYKFTNADSKLMLAMFLLGDQSAVEITTRSLAAMTGLSWGGVYQVLHRLERMTLDGQRVLLIARGTGRRSNRYLLFPDFLVKRQEQTGSGAGTGKKQNARE